MGTLLFTDMNKVERAIRRSRAARAEPLEVSARIKYLATTVSVMGEYHVMMALNASMIAVHRHLDNDAVIRAAALLHAAIVAEGDRALLSALMLHLGVMWAREGARPAIANLVLSTLTLVSKLTVVHIDRLMYDARVLLVCKDIVSLPELQTPASLAAVASITGVFRHSGWGNACLKETGLCPP